ncbi:MAG: transcriptional repressor [Rhodospirillales bacterium]|nr:transcriptional repressor [Rhodospirillales bacterium]
MPAGRTSPRSGGTILELLWEAWPPRRAYELIEALSRRNSRPIAPPTLYRALDFLIRQGLAAKIASRNAYVPRIHPERRQTCVFLLCTAAVRRELEDPRIERLLGEDATAVGFRISRPVIELEGTCPQCIDAGAVA